MLQDVQAFGVSSHEAVFDAVVDHLHEMAGARRAAMEVALFGSSADLFAARSAIDISAARRKRFENGVEVFHDIQFAANHLAVTTLEAPDAAAGPNVTIMNALAGEFTSAANIVDVVGISAVDDDVADFKLASEFVERGVHDRCRNHQPDGAGLLQFLDEIV